MYTGVHETRSCVCVCDKVPCVCDKSPVSCVCVCVCVCVRACVGGVRVSVRECVYVLKIQCLVAVKAQVY